MIDCIKRLIDEWSEVLKEREYELEAWSGSGVVEDMIQDQIDTILRFLHELETLLENEKTTC